MSKKPKSPSNKPKTVVKKRADVRRSLQQSIYPAQVLTPDQRLQLSVKTIAARQLALIEERLGDVPDEMIGEQASSVARFLKDVTVALKNVQEMERASQDDLSRLSDEQLEELARAADAREAEANERLLKALPRSKAERDEE